MGRDNVSGGVAHLVVITETGVEHVVVPGNKLPKFDDAWCLQRLLKISLSKKNCFVCFFSLQGIYLKKKANNIQVFLSKLFNSLTDSQLRPRTDKFWTSHLQCCVGIVWFGSCTSLIFLLESVCCYLFFFRVFISNTQHIKEIWQPLTTKDNSQKVNEFQITDHRWPNVARGAVILPLQPKPSG